MKQPLPMLVLFLATPSKLQVMVPAPTFVLSPTTAHLAVDCKHKSIEVVRSPNKHHIALPAERHRAQGS